MSNYVPWTPEDDVYTEWLDDDWTYLNEKEAIRTYESKQKVFHYQSMYTWTEPQRRVVRVYLHGMDNYKYTVFAKNFERVFESRAFPLGCDDIEKRL